MASHKKSARGFTKKTLVAGFILVGILALVGIINLFVNSNKPLPQTIQSTGGSQQIADSNTYILITHENFGGEQELVCQDINPQDIDEWKASADQKNPSIGGDRYVSGPYGPPNGKNDCEKAKLPSTYVTLQPTPTTNPNVNQGSCTADDCGTITPDNPKDSNGITSATIDDNTPTVTVKFNAFPSLFGKNGVKYFYCLKSSLQECGEDDWNDEIPGNQTFKVCGAGANELKTKCTSDYWFHPGSVYRIFIAQGTSEKNLVAAGNTNILTSASFYVKHFYPDVEAPKPGSDASLDMATITKTGGGSITVTLKGRSNRGAYGSNVLLNSASKADIYNDYFLQVIGVDNNYKSPEGCVYVPTEGTGTGKVALPPNSSSNFETAPLTAGNYVLHIKDGTGGNYDKNNPTCHEGDFTYYDIPITIGASEAGTIGEAIKDPRHKDTLIVLSPPPPPAPICYGKDRDKDGYCTAIPTALGFTIHTEPRLFIRDVFTIVLSIGGIAAVIFFIQAGYTLMTSAGNKEKVGAAREQITAAITGLIFIILSITILQFIGVNILHIPGFGN